MASGSHVAWSRALPWRQGSLIDADDLLSLGLQDHGQSLPPNTHAIGVIISHDCDIAAPTKTEPNVEILVGYIHQGSAGKDLTAGKNPRTLHLPNEPLTNQYIEVTFRNRAFVAKEHADHAYSLASYQPSEFFRLQSRSISQLRHWLASRYDRASFPDLFDSWFKEGKKSADKQLKAIADRYNPVLQCFLFDIDNGEDIPRHEGSKPYELSIVIVYENGDDVEAAMKYAAKAKDDIQAMMETSFSDCSGPSPIWSRIELKAIHVVSYEQLTHQDAIELKRYTFDYISMRVEPFQPMLPRC